MCIYIKMILVLVLVLLMLAIFKIQSGVTGRCKIVSFACKELWDIREQCMTKLAKWEKLS